MWSNNSSLGGDLIQKDELLKTEEFECRLSGVWCVITGYSETTFEKYGMMHPGIAVRRRRHKQSDPSYNPLNDD